MLKVMSIPLAVFAYTLLSTGFVLQKRGIGWIGFKGTKDRIYYRNLFTWIAGFLLMNLNIVPNTLALKHLDPHIVSAFAGWGIIVMVFLSAYMLKERIHLSDIWFTVIIVLSIVMLNVFEFSEAEEIISRPRLLAAIVLPFILLGPALLPSLRRTTRALLFAMITGLSTGMIIVTMKALVSELGFAVAAYFSSPLFWLYLLFSLTSFITLQAAYKLGPMMKVGPIQYSSAIIYPVVCSFGVFGSHIQPVQIAAIVLIVGGVVGILRKRA
jgi:multidrug transporter EmrE-like cation transporter